MDEGRRHAAAGIGAGQRRGIDVVDAVLAEDGGEDRRGIGWAGGRSRRRRQREGAERATAAAVREPKPDDGTVLATLGLEHEILGEGIGTREVTYPPPGIFVRRVAEVQVAKRTARLRSARGSRSHQRPLISESTARSGAVTRHENRCCRSRDSRSAASRPAIADASETSISAS